MKKILIILLFTATILYSQNTRFSRVVSDTDADSTLHDALLEKMDKVAFSDSSAGLGGGSSDSVWVVATADTVIVDSVFYGPANSEGQALYVDSTQLRLGGHLNTYGFSPNARSRQAGETLVEGDVCYLKASDGKMWKARANATITSKPNWMGVALEDLSADANGLFAKEGVYEGTGFSVGTPYYVAYTFSGGITDTIAGSTAAIGDTVHIPFGVATSSTKVEYDITQSSFWGIIDE